MKKFFSNLICDNLSDTEYARLRELKRQQKTKTNPSKFKIIITQDRRDYDNLSELMNYPERGSRVGTFYFTNPDDLDLILKAFEGLFYQLFAVGETERFGGGVVDYSIYEDWWDTECIGVCENCFLRGYSVEKNGAWYYTCKKGEADA